MSNYDNLFDNANVIEEVETLLHDVNCLLDHEHWELNRSETAANNYLIDFLDGLFLDSIDSQRLFYICFELLDEKCDTILHQIVESPSKSMREVIEYISDRRRKELNEHRKHLKLE